MVLVVLVAIYDLLLLGLVNDLLLLGLVNGLLRLIVQVDIQRLSKKTYLFGVLFSKSLEERALCGFVSKCL
jgi:hypothetical protein